MKQPTHNEATEKPKSAFLDKCVRIPISSLLSLKVLRPSVKASLKYMQILASVKELGLIEPPAITPNPSKNGYYFLLDGHLRVEALKDLGVVDVDCMIATEDDTYSYNKRVNRLAAVQDHKMIVRAIERGVSAERIGKTLNLSAETIRQKFRLLDGVCAEVANLLAEKPCPASVFRILRQMKPVRQLEAAELMIGQKIYSSAFASAILAATTPSQLAINKRSNRGGLDAEPPSAESMARMERELAALQAQNKAVEDSYGPDVLHLTVIRSYLGSILSHASVVHWLAKHQPDYLREFQNITEMSELPFSTKH